MSELLAFPFLTLHWLSLHYFVSWTFYLIGISFLSSLPNWAIFWAFLIVISILFILMVERSYCSNEKSIVSRTQNLTAWVSIPAPLLISCVPLGSCFIFLCFGFHIYKMEIITVPTHRLVLRAKCVITCKTFIQYLAQKCSVSSNIIFTTCSFFVIFLRHLVLTGIPSYQLVPPLHFGTA